MSTSDPPVDRARARVILRVGSALLVVAALAGVSSAPATAQDDGPTTTEPRRTAADPVARPTGQVAYVSDKGVVSIGSGNEKPRRIGTGAALGPSGQAAVAISPAGDLVAYVRTDGTLVTLPVSGGEPFVLASNVSLDHLGDESTLAWLIGAENIAYISTGTTEDVGERPDRPLPLSDPNAFRGPLPDGGIGDVAAVVDITGKAVSRLGDPSLRSIIGVTSSLADPFLAFDSVIPGTDDRYTMSIGAPTSDDVAPTPLSVDGPQFAPDGSFIIAVGPAKGYQEIVRVATDSLGRTTLAQQPRICGPKVSPDATRIAFGGGEKCDRLMLVSSDGGRAFDVTPLDVPDGTRFGLADLGWTADGRFITYPNCRDAADELECGGESSFLEPDSGRVLSGPAAVTVAPIVQQLVQDVYVDVQMRGPLQFRRSFQISPETQASLTDTTNETGVLSATLEDGDASMNVKLTVQDGGPFVAGSLTAVDPESGVDRTFMVLARANLVGLRVFGLSGVWYSTDDLPFATGQFNMAIRRR